MCHGQTRYLEIVASSGDRERAVIQPTRQVMAEAGGGIESAEKAGKTARAFGVLERLQVRQPTPALPRSSIVSISY
jgi:hypothetical protein